VLDVDFDKTPESFSFPSGLNNKTISMVKYFES